MLLGLPANMPLLCLADESFAYLKNVACSLFVRWCHSKNIWKFQKSCTVWNWRSKL